MLERPIILNFFGPPGSGKSTTAGEVFVALKRLDVDVELVTEYAKDLTWEKRHMALGCQPYIFGKQLRNLERLVGGVNVIVTDSPLLLSVFYTEYNCPDRYPASFSQMVLDQFQAMGGLNYFLHRTKKYNPNGRSQDEAQSDAIGVDQLSFLRRHGIVFEERPGSPETYPGVVSDVLAELESQLGKK